MNLNKEYTQLSVFHVNIRSLNANYSKLINFLYSLSFNFDVIILSETWATNLTFYINLLSNYDFFYELPKNRVGGVGIYVKKSFNANRTYKYVATSNNAKILTYETVWIELFIDKIVTVIGGFYRHPNTPIKEFTDAFLCSLDKLKRVKRCHLFGDFNVCLANYSSNANTRSFVDCVLDSKFLPYVYLPTRITNHSSSIIDHVYSNDLFTDTHTCKTGLIVNDIADHCANFMFVLDGKVPDEPEISIEKVRNFSKRNKDHFNNCLSSFDWSDVYNYSNPNDALNCFIDQFTVMHDRCFPFINNKKIKKGNNNKKWITPGLIISINFKCKLYKKWIKSKRVSDENKYKAYAKILKRILSAAEKAYYTELFDTRAHSCKAIWNNINSLINYKRAKSSDIRQIINNGISIDSPPDIANAFNNYFCTVADRLSANAIHHSNHLINFNHYLKTPIPSSFFCSSISASELSNVVKNLKPSRSCIANCISSTVLKDSFDSICQPLLYICNLSFETGIFPDKLKISKVIPIYKAGTKNELSNYRPISLTNPIAKVIEKLLHIRMTNYLEKFNLLFDFQFGFRKNYSTSIAVLDVVNMIQNELFRGNYVLGVFMDLQKAFDTVNLSILLKKLEYYGFRGRCLEWFRSYLEDRPQFTAINGSTSPLRNTTCGIPQGTVLGPLLFTLFINDIACSLTKSNIKLFADDSNLFVISENPIKLFNIANCELSSLSNWIIANKLHVNYNKTNYILFEPKAKANVTYDINNLPTIILDGNTIERVHVVKYLGVFINEKLSWTEHINHLVSKVSHLSGILYRNKLFLPMNCKRNIYFALIHSNLTYCIEVYANVNKSSLHPLIIKCNRLLRSLQLKSRRTSLFELYSSFGTLPVDLLFDYHTIKFMHRNLYNSHMMPKTVQNWFLRGSSVHAHNTRHKEQFAIQSKFDPNSLLFYGPSMWSKLPTPLQNDSSLISFLRSYKELLTNKLLK